MSQWISVKERLPEDGASALVFVPEWEDDYLRHRVAWLDCDISQPRWIFAGNALEGVTYWMPLPSPPKSPC